MIDTVFVVYGLMLVLMVGFAVAGDARRRARNRAQRLELAPQTPTRPGLT